VHFIRQIATKVLHVNAGQITPYSGGYEYFLEKTGGLADERAALTAA
jgi:ATP-binding cassette subfamily F protein 3